MATPKSPTPYTRNRFYPLVLTTSLALAVAGCSGDSASDPDPQTPPPSQNDDPVNGDDQENNDDTSSDDEDSTGDEGQDTGNDDENGGGDEDQDTGSDDENGNDDEDDTADEGQDNPRLTLLDGTSSNDRFQGLAVAGDYLVAPVGGTLTLKIMVIDPQDGYVRTLDLEDQLLSPARQDQWIPELIIQHPTATTDGRVLQTDDALYFQVFPGDSASIGAALWRTDGTDAGTFEVADPEALELSTAVTFHGLVETPEGIVFHAQTTENSDCLFRIDPASYAEPSDITVHQFCDQQYERMSMKNSLVLWNDELVLVPTVNDGSDPSEYRLVSMAPGDIVNGQTPQTTKLWEVKPDPDLPGGDLEMPRWVTTSGGHLYFDANNRAGRALYTLPSDNPGEPLFDARRFVGGPSRGVIELRDTGNNPVFFSRQKRDDGDFYDQRIAAYADNSGTVGYPETPSTWSRPRIGNTDIANALSNSPVAPAFQDHLIMDILPNTTGEGRGTPATRTWWAFPASDGPVLSMNYNGLPLIRSNASSNTTFAQSTQTNSALYLVGREDVDSSGTDLFRFINVDVGEGEAMGAPEESDRMEFLASDDRHVYFVGRHVETDEWGIWRVETPGTAR